MQSKVARTALFTAPLDTVGVMALGLALCAMAAALIAPALGLLILAALGALAVAGGEWGRSFRFDRLTLAGCVALAAAAAANGLAGATGAAFVWFMIDCARAEGRRSHGAGGAHAGALAERLALLLGAGFAVLLVAAAAPHVVMGLALNLPHPPEAMILAVGIGYALATADWMVRALARWRLGEGRLAAALAPLGFHAVLLAGFGLCPDVSAGLAGLIAYRLWQNRSVQSLLAGS